MNIFWLGFWIGAAVTFAVVFVGLCVLLAKELK